VEGTYTFGEVSAGADCHTADRCVSSWFVTEHY
jgi:hypothetical protein